jgi:peptidoglycan/xylan/chitin deacetylase (PgdA/CDA1 family)
VDYVHPISTKKLLVIASCWLMGVFMVTGSVRPNRQTVNAANDFAVDYSQNDWGSGATVSVTITNNGSSAINGWTLGWTFPGNQKITNMWNASFTQNGSSVTATNQSYNSTIPANGGKVSFGFNLSYSGTNAKPASFTLNGGPITTPEPTPTPTVTTIVTPTPTNTVPTPTPTAGPTASSGLPVPPGGSNVPKPSGTAGGLSVINWAGFKGAASYTFDDANSSQINNYQTINSLGVPMTFYLQTNKSEASNNVWAQAKNDGHELGNHTQSHAQTGSGADIDAATNFIKQKFGVTPYTMAAPYGDNSYVSLASTRFLINRGVAGGSIAPNGNSDPFNLPCLIPATGASASSMTNVVSSARSSGNWQIVLIHGFTGGSDGAYQPVALSEFTSHVKAVKAFGDMWIDSVVNIGAYWRAQKVFASLSPTKSGDDLIYKWTLPAHFPPGKYLRVKVNGGTLKQDGQILNWDGHGYYEIALDAGSLTISP